MKINRILPVLLLIFLWAASVLAEVPKKIAILPFRVHAAQDLSYVQEGIQDMLVTRLFAPGLVETVDPEVVKKALSQVKGPLTREKARALGQKLGVDYVLFGSVSVFGNTVSVDAELVPVSGSHPPVALYTQVKGLGQVIPALASFAERSRKYILGEAVPSGPVTVASSPPKAPAPITAPPPKAPAVPPSRMHPEKLVEAAPPPPPSRQAQVRSRASGMPPAHYTDVDQWPDYPPPEEALPPVRRSGTAQPPVAYSQNTPSAPPKRKKKSFFRRVTSKLWPFGKKEKEVRVSEVPPPPPPPPPPATPGSPSRGVSGPSGYGGSAGASSPSSAASPQPPTAPPQPPTAPPPYSARPPAAPPAGAAASSSGGGQTWQWY